MAFPKPKSLVVKHQHSGYNTRVNPIISIRAGQPGHRHQRLHKEEDQLQQTESLDRPLREPAFAANQFNFGGFLKQHSPEPILRSIETTFH